jgi:hypothetical protein
MCKTRCEILEIVYELDDSIRHLQRQRLKLKAIAEGLHKAEKDANAEKGASDDKR